MAHLNVVDYRWIQQTRKTLLDACEKLSADEWTVQNGYGLQSVRDTLVHMADCYHAWLGSFLLLKTKSPITSKEARQKMTIHDCIERFNQADVYVEEVFRLLGDQLDQPIERTIPWREGGDPISMTPRKLLTHTMTHEFHHKGQIVVMLRQLGHVPPNTDVLGTKDSTETET
ncbi:DinB family protein [Halalkalibacterium halodurans]|uniref:DinB family protein n=1 Tax=Halalkalibacterium halodurans TaxID=86665 RepID=UPI002AA9B82E|nr:DinB family protein [Halalkalibacterium halodurans]MDY7224182.1 DinB family protein [Halalkalibacterium halodurans]MDY7243467.1 DinB family protein [Halalkalibacterium halodurans]